MQGNRHICRSVGYAFINQPDIVSRKLVGIYASAPQVRTVPAAAQRTPGGIIQLEVAAASIIERLNRR